MVENTLTSHLRWAARLVAVALLAAAPGAAQAGWDPDLGQVVLDGAASLGLDDPEDDGGLIVRVWTLEGAERSLKQLAPRFVPERVEGTGSLRVGGTLGWVFLDLRSLASTLAGRRVSLSLWQKPQGTSLLGELGWYDGDLYQAFRNDLPVHRLGGVSLRFTGEVTDDGWERWSTGPVDFLLGHRLAPQYLYLYDRQDPAQAAGATLDPEAGVLLDAIEVVDLGPARVPEDTCRLRDEATRCTEAGACLMGRCVDAAAALGAPILDPVLREEWLGRRVAEMRIFEGSRLAQDDLDAFAAALEGLANEERPRAFWPALQTAWEGLRDGHASAPRDVQAGLRSGAVCLSPGRDDLTGAGEVVPLVFRADPEHLASAGLAPGDALVSVDGEPVATFLERAARHLPFAGDPDAKRTASHRRLWAAAETVGARLTFSRCVDYDPGRAVDPCGAVVPVEVDLAEVIGEVVWAGRPVPGSDLPGCDHRFALPGGLSSSDAFDWLEGTREDTAYLALNGFPTPTPTRQEALARILDRDVSGVVVDERLGYGGTVGGLEDLSAWFLDPLAPPLLNLVPRTDWPLDQAAVEALRGCMSTPQGELPCGWFDVWTLGASPSHAGRHARTPVALLVADAVSANDFFSRALADRDAPTAVFGPGPTRGAFGPILTLPSLFGEPWGGSFQVQDTLFVTEPFGPLPPFATGVGVWPQEPTWQLQSDALQGVDTILEEARRWLAERGEAR